MGLMDGVEAVNDMNSGEASELRYPRNNSSNIGSDTAALDCVEGCHDVSEFISKLKGLRLLLVLAPLVLNDDPASIIEFSSPGVEKSNAGVVNMGLFAMIVIGESELKSALPKPKSIRMALSAAVDWEMLPSKRLRTFGSKVLSELQSRGLVNFGEARVEDIDCAGETAGLEGSVLSVLLESFGMENVKADCLSVMFSLCRRLSISRKFSFSCWAASFLASSSATLSSS
jgi:hypothetical protein